MITHGNLAANGTALHQAWGFGPDDVLLHALPVFHIHGLFVACHCVLLNGTGMLFIPKFDVATVRRLLPRATVMMGVPTFYTRLLADPGFGREDCRHMRLFTSGSAPLLEQTFEAFEQRTGHTILERYGMTETGMNTSNPLHGERLAGTVGLPLPGVSVRITDDDDQPPPDPDPNDPCAGEEGCSCEQVFGQLGSEEGHPDGDFAPCRYNLLRMHSTLGLGQAQATAGLHGKRAN